MTSRAINATTGGCAALLIAIFFAGILTGCGGTTPTVPGSPATLTGNWELTTNQTVGGTVPIAVYLTSNAGSVSGVAVGPPATDLIAYPDGCVGSPIGMFSNVALAGTVDAEGNLKLSTAPNAIPSATMTGTVSGSSLSNGSFAISGDCTTQGTMTGIEYPAVNGTYSGTVTSQASGQKFTVTATLDQSTAPNSAGLLVLTGTAIVNGYSCVPSSAAAIGATFVGDDFFLELSHSPSGILGWSGSLSPDGKTLGINYGFSPATNTCNDDFGSGMLTLQ
jgi:hypothetical protein